MGEWYACAGAAVYDAEVGNRHSRGAVYRDCRRERRPGVEHLVASRAYI